MAYFRWYLVNPHVQVVQNMCAKGGQGVFKAVLWAAEVDPHMGPEDNFCSRKMSKDSVLAKLSDLM